MARVDILSDTEIDTILEIYDQTPISSQRKAVCELLLINSELQNKIGTVKVILNLLLGWDCIHPKPLTELCADFPWLKTQLQMIRKELER